MEYALFAREILRDKSSARLGGPEKAERTLQTYFKIVDGEKLDQSQMPLIKETFWFAYEQGRADEITFIIDVTNDMVSRQNRA